MQKLSKLKLVHVTQYEIQPPKGLRLVKLLICIMILHSLWRKDVRIEAPIPGRSVGIEVPNDKISLVTLKEVLESKFRVISRKLDLVEIFLVNQ